MARYHQIADDLRARIAEGQFGVDDKLPVISDLQRQYGGAHSHTIRQAQQVLVDEGMLTSHHGRGVYVISTEPVQSVNVTDTLKSAQAALTTALSALSSQRSLNIDSDEQVQVLADALTAYTRSVRSGSGSDSASDEVERAAVAEQLLDRVSRLA